MPDLLCTEKLTGSLYSEWKEFMYASGLSPRDDADFTVLLLEDGKIIASGSRCGNIFKYIAVAPEMQGLNLTATLITELNKDAFAHRIRRVFLYTKPMNRIMFSALHFYPVAECREALLMESEKDGIDCFLNRLAAEKPDTAPEEAGAESKTVGAIVMNCNPFTRGHRYLVEQSCSQCDVLYVFVLSEDKSEFSFEDRLEMVKLGTADLDKVRVLETGDYLISSATFPDYFLQKKSSATAVQCALDADVFARHFAKKFGIVKRFAGTEPYSEVTAAYNAVMAEFLPKAGIAFVEIPRLETGSGIAISAGAVRNCLAAGDSEGLKVLVPESTFTYLSAHGFI